MSTPTNYRNRRHNRRVMQGRGRTVRMYKSGAPIARGVITRNGVRWAYLYNVVERFTVDDAGQIVNLGYDFGVAP